MQITFLGTGTSMGVPVIMCNCKVCLSPDSKDKRLRSSIYIETENTGIVLDTGPDFRQQMLANNIKKLSAVVFTHEHKDHTAGMDDIRAYNYQKQGPIPVYCSQRVLNHLKKEYEYVFDEIKYPGIPEIDIQLIDDKPFTINDLNFTPIKVLHHKLPVLGFRINNFAYITDANFISDTEKEKLKNLDVLVLNALQHDPHISHFTFNEAIALVDELKPKHTYFTHISHKLGTHSETGQLLPNYISLAYDGLSITV
jgi:phosphoribosyl 1,2-cyclic phosphate phosphodiesterase